MHGLVCGLLAASATEDMAAAIRARDLTVSWLRWNYSGDVLEDDDLGRLLLRAGAVGQRYCLVQGHGHILIEHAGPNGGKARSAFQALEDWTRTHDFTFAGIADRCLLVDLAAWQRNGMPSVDAAPPLPFGADLDSHLLDLGADLGAGGAFLSFLDAMCEKAGRGVFVLNYESYEDVEEVPPGFRGPVSTLYCVAAGLKPNRILETHGIGRTSRVVFFDYSRQALDFRRRLDADWDGYDYPTYLRTAFARRDGAHYYLWPGADAGNMDWTELERLWTAELARWGGAEAFAAHWRRYRNLHHEYRFCNILDPHDLLAWIRDEPGAVIWWSNAFSTIYSARHHGLKDKRRLYEDWIGRLAERAPGLFLYGSDHSNSSVNGLTARDYRDGYFTRGGDPLLSRSFHRHAIRF